MTKTWDFLDKFDRMKLNKKDIEDAYKSANIQRKTMRKNDIDDELREKFSRDVGLMMEDHRVRNLIQKYQCLEGDRITKLTLLCRDAVELTEAGKLKKGDILYMKKAYADEFLRKVAQMIDYEENLGASRYYIEPSKVNSDSLQSYLNYSYVCLNGKEKKDSTMNNLKNVIIKANKLECITQGCILDYSSTIKTKADIKAINVLVNGDEKSTVDNLTEKHKSNTSNVFSNADFEKITTPIIEKLKTKPQRVTDPEIMILMCGVFGLRKSTLEKLTITDLEPSKGWIKVDAEKNKSNVAFVSKSGMYPTEESKEILQQVYKRALLRNSDKLTDTGEVPLFTCAETYIYRKFRDILSKNGMSGKYGDDKFRALRNMFAQNCYDDSRENIGGMFPELRDAADYDAKARGEIIGKTVSEVNYLLGHSDKHKNTTLGYIQNIY